MGKKIAIVTGGAGFIGSHLVDRLLSEGWRVTVVDDFSSGHIANLASSLEKHGSDLSVEKRDFGSDYVSSLVHRLCPDAVFHLAARPRVAYSVEHPAETNDVNVQRTVQLLEACRGNVGRFVFSSSSSVYGGADLLPTPAHHPKDPKSPYALQKSICEDYCKMFSKLYEMDTVCLRYFNVFGPRAKGDSPYATAVSAWIHAIKNGAPLRSDGDGTQTRDMCYVSNVVEANLLAAESRERFRGNCFNVACGDRVSNREILQYLLQRRPGIQVKDAPWRPGDVMHTQADISQTERALGYVPRVRFWEGLEMTLKSEGL